MDEIQAIDTVFVDRSTKLLKAMGHPIRLQIVLFLAEGEKSVTEIAIRVNSKIANVSRHLSKMKKGGVVVMRKSGLKCYYRLNLPFVAQVLLNLRESVGRPGNP